MFQTISTRTLVRFNARVSGDNLACLYPNLVTYDRSVLGFNEYTLQVNICDSGTPHQCGVSQFSLVVEPKNNVPPKPGHKTVTVYYFNVAGNDVPIGNVFVDGSDVWNPNDRTFKFKDPIDKFFT